MHGHWFSCSLVHLFKFLSGPLENGSRISDSPKYLFLWWGFCWRVVFFFWYTFFCSSFSDSHSVIVLFLIHIFISFFWISSLILTWFTFLFFFYSFDSHPVRFLFIFFLSIDKHSYVYFTYGTHSFFFFSSFIFPYLNDLIFVLISLF